MTAEQIVRALAAADPLTDDQGCHFCGRDIEGSEVFGRGAEPHEPDCPWRLAVEWTRDQRPSVVEQWAEWGAAQAQRRAAESARHLDELGVRTRRVAYERFGPQFFLPADVTLATVYMHGAAIELAAPVSGPGEFYFDAEARRLVPYSESEKGEAAANLKHGTGGGER